jgi:hypothetical protein
LAAVNSRRSSRVASSMSFFVLAAVEVAPRMPRHCKLPT